jgi:hypothetical protein
MSLSAKSALLAPYKASQPWRCKNTLICFFAEGAPKGAIFNVFSCRLRQNLHFQHSTKPNSTNTLICFFAEGAPKGTIFNAFSCRLQNLHFQHFTKPNSLDNAQTRWSVFLPKARPKGQYSTYSHVAFKIFCTFSTLQSLIALTMHKRVDLFFCRRRTQRDNIQRILIAPSAKSALSTLYKAS